MQHGMKQNKAMSQVARVRHKNCDNNNSNNNRSTAAVENDIKVQCGTHNEANEYAK